MENEEEIEYTFEDKVKKATDWLGKNLSGIFAVLISVFFVFQGIVDILPTTLGIKEQIIMAFVNIFAGFTITNLVGEYGFTSAKNTKKYELYNSDYNKAVRSALKYREAIDELAKERAIENLKDQRKYILEGANLYYYDIFNEKGELKTNFDIMKYKNEQGFTKKIRAYNKAVKMKIIKTNVFGRASGSLFGIKKEISEKEYRLNKGAKSLVIKILLGVGSVGIMFVYNGWSWGAIIYAFMQIVLWVGLGLIERQKNYNFVIDEELEQIDTRTKLILEFMEKDDKEKEKYINLALERKKPVLQIEQKFDIQK